MQPDSLVIFKNRPARVIASVDKKIEIITEDERSIKLPPKHLTLLYSGNFNDFDSLNADLDGEVEAAWELLQGQSTDYVELSELIFGKYTPLSAYKTWQLVNEGLLFVENDEQILVNTQQTVDAIREKERQRLEKEAALNAFINRLSNNTYAPEDEPFMKEIAGFALGRASNCRFFKHINREETMQNAHTLLLETGYWNELTNPYPARFDALVQAPDLIVDSLPDEDRVDLTELQSFAIDDADSHDPDDAISFDAEHDRLWVHIADPAALVAPDGEMDLEARSRGCNLYLPEGHTPMLPPLMTARFGLGLQTISPALSIGFNVTADGQIDEVDICRSWVKVTRLSYEQADQMLMQGPFTDFDAISRRFSDYRRGNGAVELNFPEVKLKLEIDSKVAITPLKNLRSRDIVRDAMLMAGVAVAKFGQLHDIALPYSTQPAHEL
ncbi:MAG: RNB domain-containing ribonuclease, partial [Francisellaceae bacterium]